LCRLVAVAVLSGVIPDGEPNLVAGAIIGIIVQTAAFRLYGRLEHGLTDSANALVSLSLKVVS